MVGPGTIAPGTIREGGLIVDADQLPALREQLEAQLKEIEKAERAVEERRRRERGVTFAGRPPAGTAGGLERAVFRANPRYELVLVDRLSTAERALLGASEVADLYGVLRPRGGEGPDVRAVTSETALLFLTLGEPAPLPGYVRARLGDELESTIARLVVDGVLEIEHGGRFRRR